MPLYYQREIYETTQTSESCSLYNLSNVNTLYITKKYSFNCENVMITESVCRVELRVYVHRLALGSCHLSFGGGI